MKTQCMSHQELYELLYPNGYVDFATGNNTNQVIEKLGYVPDGIVKGMRWDENLKDYIPVYKIATNRLGK